MAKKADGSTTAKGSGKTPHTEAKGVLDELGINPPKHAQQLIAEQPRVAPAVPEVTLADMEAGPPYPQPIKSKAYKRELLALQVELVKLQTWVKSAGERIVIIFEGRDAAGKGGAISRFNEHINPRGARHVALAKPNETEQTQWYFQRFVAELPSAGEIVFFDRSWYTRAGVEWVKGYCNPAQYGEFLRQAPQFEQSLVADGIRLFKLYYTVSREQQRERFKMRYTDPLKQWKLSPTDVASLGKWDQYTAARDQMLIATDSHAAPWMIVNSNEKKRARLESIRLVLNAVPYDDKDTSVVHDPDPRVVQNAAALSQYLRPEYVV